MIEPVIDIGIHSLFLAFKHTKKGNGNFATFFYMFLNIIQLYLLHQHFQLWVLLFLLL